MQQMQKGVKETSVLAYAEMEAHNQGSSDCRFC